MLNDVHKDAWNYEFNIIYRVILNSTTLETSFRVSNTGRTSFEFNSLFHTYVRVKNIHNVSVKGLKNVCFEDKEGEKGIDDRDVIIFEKEVDRVYQNIKESMNINEGINTINIKAMKASDVGMGIINCT